MQTVDSMVEGSTRHLASMPGKLSIEGQWCGSLVRKNCSVVRAVSCVFSLATRSFVDNRCTYGCTIW